MGPKRKRCKGGESSAAVGGEPLPRPLCLKDSLGSQPPGIVRALGFESHRVPPMAAFGARAPQVIVVPMGAAIHSDPLALRLLLRESRSQRGFLERLEL